MSGRFYIYWAVTAPLTVITLVIWIVWTNRQSFLIKVQDRKDRDLDALGEAEKDENVVKLAPDEKLTLKGWLRKRVRFLSPVVSTTVTAPGGKVESA